MKTSFVVPVILVTALSLGIAIGLYSRDDVLVSDAIASSHGD